MTKMLTSVKLSNLLKSRVILWLLFIICLANMYAYLMSADEQYIAFMLLSGFITSFFSKNMIVVLFFAICIPNILRFVMQWRQLQEGMAANSVIEGLETNDENKKTEDENDDEKDDEKTKSDKEAEAEAEAELSQKGTKSSPKPAKVNFEIPTEKLNNIQNTILNAKKKVQNIPDDEIRSELMDLLETETGVITKLHSIGTKIDQSN